MRYQSFRLQVWRSDRFGYAQWSARLEENLHGECHRFTSPDALLAHLHALLAVEQQADAQPPKPGENETAWPQSQEEEME
jgi:hypothetical protein